ncbi:MAG TPA: hypothetical protein VKH64_17625 [Candidatus Binatia bacterium]|nr:hypothetical protein [Candidatus Binatia bacterium]
MKKLALALSPVVVAAVFFALSGVAAAQSKQTAGVSCPPPKVAAHKITEPEALDLAQQYADKNLKGGYKVVQPTAGSGKARGPVLTGGYNTMCFNKDGDAYSSVEYSFEAKNAKGSMRILRVDQFGSVSQHREIESAGTR